MDEPNFSKAYANMCKILQMTEVQHNKETIKFRNLLITRCQHEFEGNKAPEIDTDKRIDEIKNSTDPVSLILIQLFCNSVVLNIHI